MWCEENSKVCQLWADCLPRSVNRQLHQFNSLQIPNERTEIETKMTDDPRPHQVVVVVNCLGCTSGFLGLHLISWGALPQTLRPISRDEVRNEPSVQSKTTVRSLCPIKRASLQCEAVF